MRKSTRTWTQEAFETAVKECYSIAAVIKSLGLDVSGANYSMVKRYVKEFGLDTSHWTGQGHLRGKKCPWTPKRDLADILVEHSSYTSTHNLKNRLLKAGYLENKCSECGQLPTWCDKKLIMVLDHINGVNDDHRIENLRLLCPNCNSQTDTFAGKNKGKNK